MTRYRFLNGMGDVVAEDEFEDNAAALVWARDKDEHDEDLADEDLERVEFLGPDDDWRWAGPLLD